MGNNAPAGPGAAIALGLLLAPVVFFGGGWLGNTITALFGG